MAKKKVQAQKHIIFIVEDYPENVNNIYICGNADNLGGWDCSRAIKMDKNADGSFSYCYTVKSVATVEYKYLSDKNWNSVERGIVSYDIDNRSFTTNADKTIIDKIERF